MLLRIDPGWPGGTAAAAAVLVALALAPPADARPPAPPPNVAGTSSEPPPAWFSGLRDGWFAYSSFCWTTACVDFLPPERRTDIPVLRVRAGGRIGVHLGFEPKSVLVRVLAGNARYALVARRDTSWQVRGSGLIAVEVRGGQGSASYLARVTR